MPTMPSIWNRLMLGSAVAVAVDWLCVAGWRPGMLPSRNDATAMYPLHFAWLDRQAPTWLGEVLYSPDVLGGAAVHDIVGSTAPFAWLHAAGLDAWTAMTIYVFFVHWIATFVFASWSRVQRAAPLDRSAASVGDWVEVWLASLLPILAWRLGWGHLSVVLALLPFFSFLVVWVAGARASVAVADTAPVSPVLLVAAGVATALGFSTAVQQMIVYSAVFGAPLALAVALELTGKNGGGLPVRRALSRALSLVSAAFLVSTPHWFGRWVHAASDEATRSLSGPSIIYSYLTWTLDDLVSSLPWSLSVAPSARKETFYWHETNLPLGPLFFLGCATLMAGVRRHRWGLIACVAASLAACVGFAMDLGWISSWLPTAVPPLAAFRVPMRALLIPTIFVSIRAISWLADQAGPSRRLAAALGFTLVASLLAWAPPAGREIAGWVSGLALLSFLARKRVPNPPTILALTALLAGSAGGAFRERTAPFVSINAVRDQIRSVTGRINDVVRAYPNPEDLHQPLTRVSAGSLRIPESRTNTVAIAGFSSLGGYWFPSRRFVQLVTGLAHHPPDWTSVDYEFSPGTPGFEILAALYNVAYSIERNPADGSVLGRHTHDSSRPAWFARSGSQPVPDWSALISALESTAGKSLPSLYERQLVLQADAPSYGDDCKDARVVGVDPPSRFSDEVVRVRLVPSVKKTCALTIATNFSRHLSVPPGFELYPAYGALVGVKIPPGDGSEITLPLRATTGFGPLPRFLTLLGVWGMATLLAGARPGPGRRGQIPAETP